MDIKKFLDKALDAEIDDLINGLDEEQINVLMSLPAFDSKEGLNEVVQNVQEALIAKGYNVTVGCDGSPLRTLLESVLKKLEEEKKILFCKDKGHYAKSAFHTVKMDDFLGKKAAGRNGSWGNDYLYEFWFDRRNSKKVTLRFEVGPYQATEDELCKINAMVRAVAGSSNTKGKDKTPEDQYCRIW